VGDADGQHGNDPQEQYKVWPTNEDRSPFQVALDSDAGSGLSGQPSRMADAYQYFREAAGTYLLLMGDATEAGCVRSGSATLGDADMAHDCWTRGRRSR